MKCVENHHMIQKQCYKSLLWIISGERVSVCVCVRVNRPEERECLWSCRLLCHVCQKKLRCALSVTLSVFYTVFAKIKKQLHIKYLAREKVWWCGLFRLRAILDASSFIHSPLSSDPGYEFSFCKLCFIWTYCLPCCGCVWEDKYKACSVSEQTEWVTRWCTDMMPGHM